MRRDVGRIQLCGNGQVLDCLLEAAAFLDQFIPEAVTAQESLGVFGDHLFECVDIHTVLPVTMWRMVPLQGTREPDPLRSCAQEAYDIRGEGQIGGRGSMIPGRGSTPANC